MPMRQLLLHLRKVGNLTYTVVRPTSLPAVLRLSSPTDQCRPAQSAFAVQRYSIVISINRYANRIARRGRGVQGRRKSLKEMWRGRCIVDLVWLQDRLLRNAIACIWSGAVQGSNRLLKISVAWLSEVLFA